jgi:hypothetical protein
MHDPLPADEDRRLEILFRRGAEPVADDGFSAAVMNRVARHAWRRRLVLAGAWAAGALAAFEPAWHLARTLGGGLIALGGRSPDLALVLQSPYVLGAGLLLLALPALARWVEE